MSPEDPGLQLIGEPPSLLFRKSMQIRSTMRYAAWHNASVFCHHPASDATGNLSCPSCRLIGAYESTG